MANILKVFLMAAVGFLIAQAPHGVYAREIPKAIPVDRTVVLKGYFESIKGLEFDYGKVGSVLEAIAFLALNNEVEADGKRVVHGVQYFDAKGRTLGELDLVVLGKETSAVEAVYEVKLSGNPQRAGKHGRSQLARFRNHLKENNIARVETESRQGVKLEARNFADCEKFGMIGSHGSVKAGFDREFDLARDEADVLQGWLLRRQAVP